MAEIKKSRIPTISPERLDKSSGNTNLDTSKEDRRAKAYIKGREFVQTTTIRMPQTVWEKLKLINYISKISLNDLLLKSISCYLSSDEARKYIAKAKKLHD